MESDSGICCRPFADRNRTADENGCYKAEDVMKLLKEVIGEYDELTDSYEMFEAA